MSKLFITGPPASGKSTLAKLAVEYAAQRGFRLVGFFTPEVRDSRGRRVGFDFEVIGRGRVPLARKGAEWGISFGSYKINPEAKEVFAIVREELRTAVGGRTLVILDEIGPMELLLEGSSSFFEEVLANKSLAVLGVLHRKLAEISPRLYSIAKIHTIIDLQRFDWDEAFNRVKEWIDALSPSLV